MLSGVGLEIPRAHFRPTYRVLGGEQHFAAVQSGRGTKKPRKRLSDACRAYDITGWESIDKESISRDIGEGRWRDYGQEAVFTYCEEDVSALLLRA
jgi:hypothetical protein